MSEERRFLLDTTQRRDYVARFIGKLPVENGAMEVLVRPYSPQRSTSQNARLWALHAKAAEVTGYSAEEMHEFSLMRFFGTKEIEVAGMKRLVPLERSSTKDRKRFNEFMESTEAWYIEDFGVWLDHLETA